MSKRKFSDENNSSSENKLPKNEKLYSLDSDEDDTEDEQNVLDENEIEGEEVGEPKNVGEERFTAFNMQEEMEEGHFDKEGHFIWKNEKEVRDNWLDNIDWQKIKSDKTKDENLEDSGDSDGEPFEEFEVYKQILSYMKPKETINKSLRRLGGKYKNLSSIERLKRKKAGMLDSNMEVYELTELANKVLNKTGNMDIYQETYENLLNKVQEYEKKSKVAIKEVELDMYSDDFDDKEKIKLSTSAGTSNRQSEVSSSNKVMWEFKWDLKHEDALGPYDTEQMLKWLKGGYFKTGVWTRRCGENSPFYSTNRIDFELYL